MVSIESTQNQPSDNKMFYKKTNRKLLKALKIIAHPKIL